jgi:hypothetical protein
MIATDKKPKQKWIDYHVITAVQVWQPTMRLVVLHVWDDGGKPEVDHYPVLGVEATARRTYTKSFFTEAPDPPGVRERHLLAKGWAFDPCESGVRYAPLIHIDGDIMPLHEAKLHYLSGIVEVVVCSWPAEEDEQRLADVARQMRDRLRQRQEQQAHQAKGA